MNRQFIVLVVLVMVSRAPRCARAQTEVCSQYAIPVVMRDARGELVHGFSRDDLDLKLNGAPIEIDRIDRESRPRRIVILLDASASMRGIEKEVPWSQAIASAKLLTSVSEGRAQLALLIFNAKVIEEISFGSDNSAITKRLSELEKDKEFFAQSVHGTTALYDTMGRALELLGQPTSADELYVASDGADTHSRLSLKELERKLGNSGVQVFVSLLETPLGNRSRTPEELNAGQNSSEIAERTGGEFIYVSPTGVGFGFDTHPKPSRPEGLRMFFAGMFESDILQVSTANQVLGKRDLKIALSATARERLKGVQLFYPHQLYACAASQGASNTH